MRDSMKVGIVGCGKISDIYFTNCARLAQVEVVVCSDLLDDRARAAANKYAVPRVLNPDKLMEDPEVELILNLTIPAVHYDIALAALQGAKHVYNEKPLTITYEQGKNLMRLAQQKSLRVGCAPDTFLGGGLQTCRKLIDDGRIGRCVSAAAFMMSHGVENWHPSPVFYYEPGGGPMLDMGPYYLTALVHLLGPIQSVCGMTGKAYDTRLITSEPLNGSEIEVKVPTHVAGQIHFAGGAIATIVTSFDVWRHSMPPIEVYGTDGSLSVPDPNTFGGPVKIASPEKNEWENVPLTHANAENSRGIGIADMAEAIRQGRPHRADGQMALHVLEAMHAFHKAHDTGKTIELETTCDRPEPIPAGLADGQTSG